MTNLVWSLNWQIHQHISFFVQDIWNSSIFFSLKVWSLLWLHLCVLFLLGYLATLFEGFLFSSLANVIYLLDKVFKSFLLNLIIMCSIPMPFWTLFFSYLVWFVFSLLAFIFLPVGSGHSFHSTFSQLFSTYARGKLKNMRFHHKYELKNTWGMWEGPGAALAASSCPPIKCSLQSTQGRRITNDVVMLTVV